MGTWTTDAPRRGDPQCLSRPYRPIGLGGISVASGVVPGVCPGKACPPLQVGGEVRAVVEDWERLGGGVASAPPPGGEIGGGERAQSSDGWRCRHIHVVPCVGLGGIRGSGSPPRSGVVQGPGRSRRLGGERSPGGRSEAASEGIPGEGWAREKICLVCGETACGLDCRAENL